jgi:hypothetical protein
MDNVPLDLIVGAIIAIIAAATKKSSKSKNADSAQTAQDTMSATPPVLTEADRRYREVQEEIRRRIAQRNQNPPNQSATVTPNPVTDYKRSRQSTQPINPNLNVPLATARPKKSARPSPPPLQPPTKTIVVEPMMADAPAMEAAPAYPSEAAAYALPQDSGDNAASSGTSPGGGNALRAILASPNAARQAYLLREIFAQPLSLNPMGSGGHEDWT